MSRSRNPTNPFYILLVGVGILFAVTACAYGVMTVRMIEPAAVEAEAHAPHDLLGFMDRHGFTVLMVELGVLAVLTVAAIGTDSWWIKRADVLPAASQPGEERKP